MAYDGNAWIDREVAGCRFADERLGRRLRTLLDQMAGAMGESLPLACQDWANTKAAYRFFSNDRVSEGQILGGHFRSTRDRFASAGGLIMVLHDTTEFSYRRRRAEQIGQTCRVNSGKDKKGRFRLHTVCGLLMHSSLAVTTEGLPLGLAAVKFWTRKKFKGTAALKRKVSPTRIPIERKESIRWLDNMRQSTALFGDPGRCIHIGDRESDIYELFCLARELGTHFLVRRCVDRLAGDGTGTVHGAMDEVPVQGRHRVEVRDGEGALETAVVELSYRSLRILPPIGKQKRYPALTLTPDGPARPRAGRAGSPAPHRLEAGHRLARSLEPSGRREAPLVRPAVEDRGVPQGPEIRLQGGRRAVEDGGAPGEADRGLLHPELAGLLDDDDRPVRPGCRAGLGPDGPGDGAPRPSRPRQGLRSTTRTDPGPLPG
jgi:transposase-like protein